MYSPADVAEGELGIKEATGHNDGIPAEKFMRGDELAWCAGFAMWCYAQSDWPNIAATAKEYYRGRLVKNLEKMMQERNMWFGPSLHSVIKRGDLIFFGTRGKSDKGNGRHVGIVDRVEGRYVHTIEGNLSDQVKRATHALVSKRITGYARTLDPVDWAGVPFVV